MALWLFMISCTSFPGKADGSFTIEMRYQGWTPNSDERAAIEEAADRWERVIVDDLVDEELYISQEAVDDLGETPCFAVEETIDDVVVFVSINDNQRTSFVSHVCTRRSEPPFETSTGGIWLGTPALDGGTFFNELHDSVTHEIGHVLGLRASAWNLDIDGDGIWERNLLPDMPECGNEPIHYVGPLANSIYQDLGGTGQLPMEDQGQTGTACEHWDAGVLDGEIMTAFGGSERAISAITVGAIEELGYGVSIDNAEPYELP